MNSTHPHLVIGPGSMGKPMIPDGDRRILRDLARRYLDICHTDRNNEKRELWRQHNSLKPTRPLFIALTRTHFIEDPEAGKVACQDLFLQLFERELKRRLYHAACDDDTVFEPWLVHGSTPLFPVPAGDCWGVPFAREQVTGGTGWHIKPTILGPDDIHKLAQPPHRVNETVTEEGRAKLAEAVGNLLPVIVDRGAMLRSFPGDISTDIGFLRGQEQMLWDMVDRPEWYHRLLAFLRDGVLKNHAEGRADAGGTSGADSGMVRDRARMRGGIARGFRIQLPNPCAFLGLWFGVFDFYCAGASLPSFNRTPPDRPPAFHGDGYKMLDQEIP